MTTSQTSKFLTEILSEETIPIGKLAYFRARLTNEIHAVVLEQFARLRGEGKINKKKLAERIGRSPEQITRWLSGPGNWTIETLSDLLLGMKCEARVSVSSLTDLIVYSEERETFATQQAAKQTTGRTEAIYGTNTINEIALGTSGSIMVPRQPMTERVQYVAP